MYFFFSKIKKRLKCSFLSRLVFRLPKTDTAYSKNMENIEFLFCFHLFFLHTGVLAKFRTTVPNFNFIRLFAKK